MPRKRPGALVAAAVMSIIYGALGAVCGVIGVAGLLIQSSMGAPEQRQAVEFFQREIPGYMAVNWLNSIGSTVEALTLIIAGIFLLNNKGWARVLAIAFVIFSMVRVLGYAGYRIIFEFPAITRFFDQGPPGGQLNQDMIKALRLGMTIGVIIASVVYVLVLIYQFIVLMLLLRSSVGQWLADPRYDDAYQDYGERRRAPADGYDEGWDARRPADDQKDEWRYK